MYNEDDPKSKLLFIGRESITNKCLAANEKSVYPPNYCVLEYCIDAINNQCTQINSTAGDNYFARSALNYTCQPLNSPIGVDYCAYGKYCIDRSPI